MTADDLKKMEVEGMFAQGSVRRQRSSVFVLLCHVHLLRRRLP